MKDVSFLIDYHIWAHTKVMRELLTLDDEEWVKILGGSFPSQRLLMEHLVAADYRWLQRWKGTPIADIPASLTMETPAQLRHAWQPILDEMKRLVQTVYKNDLEKPITFITSRGDKYTMPFWQTFYQVVNHGTYHRGQITGMMRMLGKKPVSTDMFLFFNDKG
jgi:uncharacterized damage-inducible protein DinB